MKTRKKRKPVAIVKLDRGRLSPVSTWDAEIMDDMKQGQEFDLVPRSKRSGAHNSLYWVQLNRIVKATEAWATAYHMHDWIKMKLGYVSPVFGPKGDVTGMTIDSTSFDNMDQTAFNSYHEKAARLIAEEMGVDVDAL